MSNQAQGALATGTEAAMYQRTAVISLDELTPFPGNAKRGDVDAILQSLRRNGQYRALVVREVEHGPLIVLAGNHTMQALALHGQGACGQTVRVRTSDGDVDDRPCGVCGNQPWEPAARCEIITCDDAAARRINLADNKIPELGTYDNDALAELLSHLDGDYTGAGYTEADVEALIAPPDVLPDEGDASVSDTDAVWGVIVTCSDERQQSELLARLDGEGYAVRALVG